MSAAKHLSISLSANSQDSRTDSVDFEIVPAARRCHDDDTCLRKSLYRVREKLRQSNGSAI
jgi:hypothetical protein